MQRATRDTWATRVARWKDGGLSAAAFAAQVGVNPHKLTWWKRQLDSKGVSDSAKGGLACRPAEPIPKRTTSLTADLRLADRGARNRCARSCTCIERSDSRASRLRRPDARASA